MEALIAAIYLDGGVAPARAIILRLWEPYLEAGAVIRKDPKTFLQEWALGHALSIPGYRVLRRKVLITPRDFRSRFKSTVVQVPLERAPPSVRPSRRRRKRFSNARAFARDGK